MLEQPTSDSHVKLKRSWGFAKDITQTLYILINTESWRFSIQRRGLDHMTAEFFCIEKCKQLEIMWVSSDLCNYNEVVDIFD